jgi:hypothetical protein
MYTVDDVICPEFSAFQRLYPAFIFWGGVLDTIFGMVAPVY